MPSSDIFIDLLLRNLTKAVQAIMVVFVVEELPWKTDLGV